MSKIDLPNMINAIPSIHNVPDTSAIHTAKVLGGQTSPMITHYSLGSQRYAVLAYSLIQGNCSSFLYNSQDDGDDEMIVDIDDDSS